jgi:hypothetical protein
MVPFSAKLNTPSFSFAMITIIFFSVRFFSLDSFFEAHTNLTIIKRGTLEMYPGVKAGGLRKLKSVTMNSGNMDGDLWNTDTALMRSPNEGELCRGSLTLCQKERSIIWERYISMQVLLICGHSAGTSLRLPVK